MNTKNKISATLYWSAIVFSILNFAAIVIIAWEFISTGKGIGSFALIWFSGYFIISFVAWVIAFFVSQNGKWDVIYWISIAVPIAMFFILEIKFSL